jgi:hypothetical protein
MYLANDMKIVVYFKSCHSLFSYFSDACNGLFALKQRDSLHRPVCQMSIAFVVIGTCDADYQFNGYFEIFIFRVH